jgi:hypothetical protein
LQNESYTILACVAGGLKGWEDSYLQLTAILVLRPNSRPFLAKLSLTQQTSWPPLPQFNDNDVTIWTRNNFRNLPWQVELGTWGFGFKTKRSMIYITQWIYQKVYGIKVVSICYVNQVVQGQVQVQILFNLKILCPEDGAGVSTSHVIVKSYCLYWRPNSNYFSFPDGVNF